MAKPRNLPRMPARGIVSAPARLIKDGKLWVKSDAYDGRQPTVRMWGHVYVYLKNWVTQVRNEP